MLNRYTSVGLGERTEGPAGRRRPLVVCDRPAGGETPSSMAQGPVVVAEVAEDYDEEEWAVDLVCWTVELPILLMRVTETATVKHGQANLCSHPVLIHPGEAWQATGAAKVLALPHPNGDRDHRRSRRPPFPLRYACYWQAVRSPADGDRRGHRVQSCERCLHESHHGS